MKFNILTQEYIFFNTEAVMNLTKNVGSADKIIRLVAGAALLAWGLLGAGLASTAGIVAAVAGVVFLVTGLINFCPVFKLLGISSFRQG